jgi:hypothetical protein
LKDREELFTKLFDELTIKELERTIVIDAKNPLQRKKSSEWSESFLKRNLCP